MLFETKSMCWLVDVPKKRKPALALVVAVEVAHNHAAFVEVVVDGIDVTIAKVPSALKLSEEIVKMHKN